MTDKITTRPICDADRNFILATWLKSFKNSGAMVIPMRDTDYYSLYEPMLKSALYTTETLVACLSEDPHIIIGYLNYEPKKNTANYLFIKETWRKMGIAKHLHIKSGLTASCWFTHWTEPMVSIQHKFPGIRYNPWRF